MYRSQDKRQPEALQKSAKVEMMRRLEEKRKSKTHMEHHLRKIQKGKHVWESCDWKLQAKKLDDG
jgi:hypothetical protein